MSNVDCKEKDETIDHLVIPTTDKWWEHKIDKVMQNESVKILWDFKIQTDRRLPHNMPDITVVEKDRVWIIDVAIPGDSIKMVNM